MVYFGEALSHASLLGIAFSLYWQLPLSLGIWLISLLLIVLLNLLKKRGDPNAILGTLAHVFLALGLIAIAQMEHIRTDLMAYLFGDILNVRINDLWLILGVSLVGMLILIPLWNPLILSTCNPDIAQVAHKKMAQIEFIFTVLLGIYIGVMVQFLGLLLIMALLIIPVQAAHFFAKTPEQCAIFAGIITLFASTGGFYLAYSADLAPSPSIVACAGGLWALLALANAKKLRQ